MKLVSLGGVLLVALACASGGAAPGSEPEAESEVAPAAQQEQPDVVPAAFAPAPDPAPALGSASDPATASVSGPAAAPAPGVAPAPAQDVASVSGITPAPATGAMHPAHPASARARWATNPVIWSGEEPTPYRKVFDPEAARARSLVARAARRAYDGAPPELPHSEDFGGTLACLDCHESGRVIGNRVARPMSHQPMTNCTQCHVSRRPEALTDLEPPVPVVQGFVGLLSPGPGLRMSPGAPPTMPHTSLLRVRCLSCHGENGYEGLRTDHPSRASCTQCHLPMAARDPLAPRH